jgi:hypothetical protein
MMSEQLKESWKEAHKMAQETLKKMNENSQDWFKEFEKMEEQTNGLILAASKRIEDSSEDVKNTYKEQLERAN